MDEKRQQERLDFQKWVQIFPVLPSGPGSTWEIQDSSIGAWANNISEGGLQVETCHPFNPNFPLKLNIEFEKGRFVETYGKMIWSHGNHCGIRFMWMDERLRKCIQSVQKMKNNSN